jgi:uncharacterized coiled-coil protein SlyX
MFAVDGCKLGSNASKEWSGTLGELKKKQQKMEQAVRYLLEKHKEMDSSTDPDPMVEREQRQIETLRAKIKKLKSWLKESQEKIGKSGKPRKSKLTDNESAKINGYDGVAAVDSKHQVVVHAEAFGQPQEHELLKPMIEGIRKNFQAIGVQGDIFEQTQLTADAGFHTEQNMKMLFEEQIDGYVADMLFRKRDPRFKTADRHKPNKEKLRGHFKPPAFIYDQATQTCSVLPATSSIATAATFRSGVLDL